MARPTTKVIRLTDAQRSLVEGHVPFVYWFLNRQQTFVHRVGYTEAESALMEALCRAADGFDPARGKFTTYLARCLSHRVWEETRRYLLTRPLWENQWIDESDRDDDAGWTTPTVTDADPYGDDGDPRLRRMLCLLDDDADAELVRDVYGIGRPAISMRQITRDRGIVDNQIRRRLRRVYARIAHRLDREADGK